MTGNPYEPTTIQAPPGSSRRSELRALPAGIFMLIGVVVVVFSGGAIIQSTYLAARGYTFPFFEVFLNLTILLLFGSVCIAASVFFWQAKYRKGVYTVLAAVAVFAIAAAVRSLF